MNCLSFSNFKLYLEIASSHKLKHSFAQDKLLLSDSLHVVRNFLLHLSPNCTSICIFSISLVIFFYPFYLPFYLFFPTLTPLLMSQEQQQISALGPKFNFLFPSKQGVCCGLPFPSTPLQTFRSMNLRLWQASGVVTTCISVDISLKGITAFTVNLANSSVSIELKQHQGHPIRQFTDKFLGFSTSSKICNSGSFCSFIPW